MIIYSKISAPKPIDHVATGSAARAWREENHATQTQIGAVMGFSQNYIALLESGKRDWNEKLHANFVNAVGQVSRKG